MAAASRTLTADRGATLRLAVRYLTPSGTPVDLTGRTAVLEVLPVVADAVAASTFTGTAGADGWVTVNVADEVTQGWSEPMAYRLVLDPAGARDYLLVGRLNVRSPGDV